MLWNDTQRAETLLNEYVNGLTKNILMKDVEPLAEAIQAKWFEITGIKVEFDSYLGNYYLYLDMGVKMPNGEYPDKGKHLGQLLEFIEDILGYRVDRKRGRYDQVDKWNHSFRWNGCGHFPSWAVHAEHGGNCKLVEVSREMVEQVKYDTVCD